METVNELVAKCETAVDCAGVYPRSQLVLSLFPGIDLLGRAFESVGFCVVRGPDLITGGDVRNFRGVPGRFDGIIGGPPCQGFSAANRYRNDPNHESVRNSKEMLRQFLRVVHRCQPTWWALENVPAVPDVRASGYEVQRVPISDRECGGDQIRTRHIQFGHREGWIIRPQRAGESVNPRRKTGPVAASITTKPNSKWESFADHCRRQGFKSSDIKLPGMTKEAKFRAVGNGVPFLMGSELAVAVSVAGPRQDSDCPCGCGRILTGRQRASTATCRKRLQLARDYSRTSNWRHAVQ